MHTKEAGNMRVVDFMFIRLALAEDTAQAAVLSEQIQAFSERGMLRQSDARLVRNGYAEYYDEPDGYQAHRMTDKARKFLADYDSVRSFPVKVLQKFEKPIHQLRVYLLGAFLWRIWREKKVRDVYHLKLAYRLNLTSKQGVLTDTGCAFAKRHEDRFIAMTKSQSSKEDEEVVNE